MIERRLLLGGMAAAGALSLAPAWAQTLADTPLRRVSVRRSVRIGGRNVRYRAIIAETLIPARDARPAAIGVTNAYVAEGVRNPATRPVLFAFNGGPGASSTPLHFQAFGPRRMIREPGQPARLADNLYSPLDTMDLVFIDPVGTGYTRVLNEADGQPYWDVMGDAQAVTEIIQGWLLVNGRENSPKFVLGESYGGTRLAAILKINGVRFNGALMFVGSLMTEGGPDLDNMLMLPSMAATARFHRITNTPGTTAEVFESAYQYAMRDYAVALLQGADLSAAERDNVAARLSSLIGLPTETILAQNLRIGVEFYVRELLKSRNLRIGRLDSRVTGALDAPPARPPYDDPSMRQRSVGGATYEDYFGGELGFSNPTPYNALNLDINALWTFGPRRGPRPDYAGFIGEAMANDPALRLYSAAGYFDLGVPVAGARYALAHGGIPRERVEFRYYDTGHTLFDTDENLNRVANDVRAFVRG